MRPAMSCALILAALSSIGCRAMKPLTLDEMVAIKPARVWVTQPDGSVIIVNGPQVLGDTLVGYVNGTYQEIPAAHQLTQVRARRPAPGRTVLLSVAIAVGVGGFAYALTGAGSSGEMKPGGICDERPEDPLCNPNSERVAE